MIWLLVFSMVAIEASVSGYSPFLFVFLAFAFFWMTQGEE